MRDPGQGRGVVDDILEPVARPGGFSESVLDWSRSILVAFALFLLIRTFVIAAYKIPTSSMENTLLVGDFLLVNRVVYGVRVPGTEFRLPALDEPDRGDVIVFNPPHEPDTRSPPYSSVL